MPRFRRRRRRRWSRETRARGERGESTTAGDKGSASMNQCQKGRTMERRKGRTRERERERERPCFFSAAQQITSCSPPLPSSFCSFSLVHARATRQKEVSQIKSSFFLGGEIRNRPTDQRRGAASISEDDIGALFPLYG